MKNGAHYSGLDPSSYKAMFGCTKVGLKIHLPADLNKNSRRRWRK